MKKSLPVSKKVNGKRTSSDHDLWDHVIESVKPLQGDLKNRATEKEIWSTSDNVVLERSQRNKSLSSFSNNLGRPASLPILSHGTHAGLDKSNAKKLKKGKHPIEGQIDLHGMNQKQAYVATNDFIENSYIAGKRCVLIITGKGNKLDGAVGVLRLAVPRWLNEEPNRSRVLAFSYALPKDGGEGALYIMLKRNR